MDPVEVEGNAMHSPEKSLIESEHYNDGEEFDEDEGHSSGSGLAEDDLCVNATKELLPQTGGSIIPIDRYYFNYIIFYLLGMTTLLPWNFFITAEDYWMYKFRNVTNNATNHITPIQASFTSDLSVASAIPNTLFLILNAFIGHKIPLRIRMVGSMLFVLIFFVVTTALVEVNTDSWQHNFFIITIVSVVVMNVATAILSGGLFGISGKFPSEYITAVVSGQALGGIFAALAEIFSITLGASAKTSGFVYFMIGNFVLIIALISYQIMSRTNYFKYYTIGRLGTGKPGQCTEISTIMPRRALEPNFIIVFKKIWMYALAEWMVFVVTLSIYPSITVLVISERWTDQYFKPVVNYLIFNIGDYLGRIVSGMLEWPTNKPWLIVVFTIARFAFVPALLLCHTDPRNYLPVLIRSDYIYIILMVFFSFTNGYFANLALICAPKCVHTYEKEMASSTMAAFLGIGLAFGSSISLFLVNLL